MFSLLLSACGGTDTTTVTEEIPPVPTPQVSLAGKAVEDLSSTSEIKEEAVVFRYNPEGRRDPFRSILAASRNAQKRRMDLPPLQRLSLSELKLIGIVWGGYGFGAIVQTPDGKGYTLRKGTRIGIKGGIVRRITKEEVLIREIGTNIFGETETSTVVMKLHPQEEGLE
ncbi:MAG: pilus assembly protein PilP [Nitrospiria bacterium]